ncbi:hypothetical protein BC936DRAFT_146266 [Jimgerdemannia flammicorona]|uniref:Uncharacterized protein n=1 Tax=Jimgerdemannia flammicorona TaxID=994334 RepID=A0A433DN96_9FUNG|nr:hypothetical protein BC936DRAFT_146266 [Jimgerdemannia flammicorona]
MPHLREDWDRIKHLLSSQLGRTVHRSFVCGQWINLRIICSPGHHLCFPFKSGFYIGSLESEIKDSADVKSCSRLWSRC